MQSISKTILLECKSKLLIQREELLNRSLKMKADHSLRDCSGDEADLAIHWNAENQFLSYLERFRGQILEIDAALSRIEKGEFGLCEETLEPIEENRLLAIPSTRLSIEGAEVRDKKQRRVQQVDY